MKRFHHRRVLLLSLASTLLLGCPMRRPPTALWQGGPQFLPAPLEIEREENAWMPVSRVVTDDLRLLPLARLLAGELEAVHYRALPVANDRPQPGDIVLAFDDTLRDEEYVLNVGDAATVTGGSYQAVAYGTVSLLQAATSKPRLRLPRMSVRDAPDKPYRGLLVDVARQFHSIETLEQLIILCRLYKIRYLQIHLTDDQSFTFPSTAYPKLASKDRHYTLEQLEALVAFADVRGVTLIPELDGPGHSTAMRKAMPELFGEAELGVIDLGNDDVYPAMATLIGELCEVFASSPYIHIGADEAWFHNLKQKLGEGDEVVHDLFLTYIVRMNEAVRKCGKQTSMWESFRGRGSKGVTVPNDILVIAWETAYQLPQSLLANGYTIVNASWQPAYITPFARWPARQTYEWNIYRWENWVLARPSYKHIQLPESSKIIGAQMCSWEMHERDQIPMLRRRLPALAERVWRASLNAPSWDEFAPRLSWTDVVFQRLIRPVYVRAIGIDSPAYEGGGNRKDVSFTNQLELEWTTPVPNGTVRATLDGQAPAHPAHATLTNSAELRAQAVDANGNAIGYPVWTRYELRPIRAEVTGVKTTGPHQSFWAPRSQFVESVHVTLTSTLSSGEIRYTTDGKKPTASSEVYSGPLELRDTTLVRAQVFDGGTSRGEIWQRRFSKVAEESD